jgi:flagellar basal body rod protein FlgG
MDGIEWASSAMTAAQSRLDIATQNLANLSTDGYRKHDARGFLTARGASVTAVQVQQHGALRRTGRPFDLAIVGDGNFRVADAKGHVTLTRNGAFSRDRAGHLRDDAGRVLLGRNAPLRIPEDARIDAAGTILRGNTIVDRIPLPRESSLQTGALETSGVDPISEMIDVLTAQRAFEGAEKVVAAIDQTRQQSNDAGRLK